MKRNSAIVPCTECVYADPKPDAQKEQKSIALMMQGEYPILGIYHPTGLCRRCAPRGGWVGVWATDGCGEGKREGKKGGKA